MNAGAAVCQWRACHRRWRAVVRRYAEEMCLHPHPVQAGAMVWLRGRCLLRLHGQEDSRRNPRGRQRQSVAGIPWLASNSLVRHDTSSLAPTVWPAKGPRSYLCGLADVLSSEGSMEACVSHASDPTPTARMKSPSKARRKAHLAFSRRGAAATALPPVLSTWVVISLEVPWCQRVTDHSCRRQAPGPKDGGRGLLSVIEYRRSRPCPGKVRAAGLEAPGDDL